jgi:uncharacterized protein (TIGR02145 family)
MTMTDATGCPGHFCKYIGRDLYVDATHKCDLRTSGAKNWEAWIKDTRDDQLYRIVQMPDQKWYTAQNLNYRGITYYCYGGNATYCNETNGVWYRSGDVTNTTCPAGWLVPSDQVWSDLIYGYNLTKQDLTSTQHSGTDTYGMTAVLAGMYSYQPWAWYYYGSYEVWWSSVGAIAVFMDFRNSRVIEVTCWRDNCARGQNDAASVRCFRQL